MREVTNHLWEYVTLHSDLLSSLGVPGHRFRDFAGISEGQLETLRDDPQHAVVTLKGEHSTETAGTDFKPS